MKQSELRKLIREEVKKALKEVDASNVYPIHMRIAKLFSMDIEDLQEECDTEYGLNKYSQDMDYKWIMERGDDFPNAIQIINKRMLSDAGIMDMLDFLAQK